MEGLSQYEKEVRPWGNFERLTLNEPSTVKLITLNPGEAFSLQTHEHRQEFWRILSGSGVVTVGQSRNDAASGMQFFIHTKEAHRAEAGPDGLQFLELAFGQFDEQDIARIEDRYGRV